MKISDLYTNNNYFFNRGGNINLPRNLTFNNKLRHTDTLSVSEEGYNLYKNKLVFSDISHNNHVHRMILNTSNVWDTRGNKVLIAEKDSDEEMTYEDYYYKICNEVDKKCAGDFDYSAIQKIEDIIESYNGLKENIKQKYLGNFDEYSKEIVKLDQSLNMHMNNFSAYVYEHFNGIELNTWYQCSSNIAEKISEDAKQMFLNIKDYYEKNGSFVGINNEIITGDSATITASDLDSLLYKNKELSDYTINIDLHKTKIQRNEEASKEFYNSIRYLIVKSNLSDFLTKHMYSILNNSIDYINNKFKFNIEK